MLNKTMVGRGNLITGKSGEEIAEGYLRNKRFKIVERNFRTPFGEIDLIAMDRDIIVFVEVKTRISKNFGPPSLAIIGVKKRTIIKNATYYLKRFRLSDRDTRIDVIAINMDENGSLEKLEHIKSAIWVK